MEGFPLLGCIPLTLALCAAAGSAPDTVTRERLDPLVRPYTDGGWCRSVVVGLVDETGSRVYGYGSGSEKDSRAPDGDTVYEIGSVTKAFTGILLAEMASRGEVELDEPVRKLLPEKVQVPRRETTEITLRHLATHTSALPRLPFNLKPKDAGNPYADYTVAQLYAFLADCRLLRKPGEEYEYSNLGAGLLGHALALRAGKSYEQLVRERICRPLELRDTRITLDADLRRRLAPGCDADGRSAANWDLPTLAGAGALRSTANDLCRLVSAVLGLKKSPLDEALRTAQRPHFDDALGLGWHLGPALKSVWHNGQTGGYHSYVGFVPERKVGVVVLSNTAAAHVDEIGDNALRLMLGQETQPPRLRKTLTLEPRVLEGYVGTYRLSPAFAIAVTREGSRLYAQATGQERFGIYPETETRFFYRIVEAELTFQRNEGGEVTGLILRQNGRDTPGKRVASARTRARRSGNSR